MKINIFVPILLFLCILITSCQKQFSNSVVTPANPASGGKGNLVRIRQGTDPATDTVTLIAYDSLNRIRTITDSTNHDTLFATYDAAGRLSAITESYGMPYDHSNASFTYGATGLLTQIDYDYVGKERYVFEYSNGVVVRKTEYADVGPGGAMQLYRYYVYQVTGGNITGMQTYTPSNTLVSEKKFTYGPQPNTFKNISLFNFANYLGLDQFANFETYFCTNIITGNSSNSETETLTNTFNALQKPVKIICNHQEPASPAYILTWSFSYN